MPMRTAKKAVTTTPTDKRTQKRAQKNRCVTQLAKPQPFGVNPRKLPCKQEQEGEYNNGNDPKAAHVLSPRVKTLPHFLPY